jgi:hypothetical protein
MNNQPNNNEQKAGPQSPNASHSTPTEQNPAQDVPGQDQQPGKTGESQPDTSKENNDSARR